MTLSDRNQFAQAKFNAAINSYERWRARIDAALNKPKVAGWAARTAPMITRPKYDHGDPVPGRFTHRALVMPRIVIDVQMPMKGGCKYPIGDPKEKGFHFCRKRRVLGSSYCPEHRDLCRQRYHVAVKTPATGGKKV